MLRHIKGIAAAVLVALAVLAMTAEEAAQTQDEKGANKQTVEVEVEAKASKTDEAIESPEVFIPTEDISEDYAVSFPVDI